MRPDRLSFAVAIAFLLCAPIGSAGGPLAPLPGDEGELLACYEGALPTGPAAECPELTRVDVQGETYYLAAYGVYREDNGCEGLQTLPSDCDGDGDVEARDNWQNLYDVAGDLPYYQEAYDALDATYRDALFRLRCLAHEVYGESVEGPDECEDVLTAAVAAPPTSPAGEAIACIEGQYAPDGDGTAPCPEIARADLDGERYYLAADWIYRESNGCDGLQTQPGDCDGDGSPEQTDDFYSVREVATHTVPQLHPAFEALVPVVDLGFVVIDLGLGMTFAAVDVSHCIASWQIGTPDAEEECEATTQAIDTPTGSVYFQPQPFRLFTEDNGCEGLQRAPSDCDGDGETEPADAEVLVPGVTAPLALPWGLPSDAGYYLTVAETVLTCSQAHYTAGGGACPGYVLIEHGSTYYVGYAPVGPSTETNGCDGWQAEPTDCDGDGELEPADEEVVAPPIAAADATALACDVEAFLVGHGNACAEIRAPTRAGELLVCLTASGTTECGAIADVELGWGTFYATPAGLFEETNGCAGWQASDGDCDGDGSSDAADKPMRLLWPWS